MQLDTTAISQKMELREKLGASAAVQQVKLLPATPASHFRASFLIPAIQLATQLPANASGEAVEDRTRMLDTLQWETDGVPSFRLQPGPLIMTTWVVNHQDSLSPCLSRK